jgi:hypothetical protein
VLVEILFYKHGALQLSLVQAGSSLLTVLTALCAGQQTVRSSEIGWKHELMMM